MASIKISINGKETTAEVTQVKLPLANGAGYAYYDYASEDEAPVTPETPADGILYQLPEGTTFDGATSIDTGVKLMETDRAYSIVFEGTPADRDAIICDWKDTSDATLGFMGGTLTANAIQAYKNCVGTVFSVAQYMKVAVVHEAGSSTLGLYVKNATGSMETRAVSGAYEHVATSKTLIVGGNGKSTYYRGTMDQFIVYGKALSADELAEFFA